MKQNQNFTVITQYDDDLGEQVHGALLAGSGNSKVVLPIEYETLEIRDANVTAIKQKSIANCLTTLQEPQTGCLETYAIIPGSLETISKIPFENFKPITQSQVVYIDVSSENYDNEIKVAYKLVGEYKRIYSVTSDILCVTVQQVYIPKGEKLADTLLDGYTKFTSIKLMDLSGNIIYDLSDVYTPNQKTMYIPWNKYSFNPYVTPELSYIGVLQPIELAIPDSNAQSQRKAVIFTIGAKLVCFTVQYSIVTHTAEFNAKNIDFHIPVIEDGFDADTLHNIQFKDLRPFKFNASVRPVIPVNSLNSANGYVILEYSLKYCEHCEDAYSITTLVRLNVKDGIADFHNNRCISVQQYVDGVTLSSVSGWRVETSSHAWLADRLIVSRESYLGLSTDNLTCTQETKNQLKSNMLKAKPKVFLLDTQLNLIKTWLGHAGCIISANFSLKTPDVFLLYPNTPDILTSWKSDMYSQIDFDKIQCININGQVHSIPKYTTNKLTKNMKIHSWFYRIFTSTTHQALTNNIECARGYSLSFCSNDTSLMSVWDFTIYNLVTGEHKALKDISNLFSVLVEASSALHPGGYDAVPINDWVLLNSSHKVSGLSEDGAKLHKQRLGVNHLFLTLKMIPKHQKKNTGRLLTCNWIFDISDSNHWKIEQQYHILELSGTAECKNNIYELKDQTGTYASFISNSQGMYQDAQHSVLVPHNVTTNTEPLVHCVLADALECSQGSPSNSLPCITLQSNLNSTLPQVTIFEDEEGNLRKFGTAHVTVPHKLVPNSLIEVRNVGYHERTVRIWIPECDNYEEVQAYVQAGCFLGTAEQFWKSVKKTYGTSNAGKAYRGLAIRLLAYVFAMRTPKEHFPPSPLESFKCISSEYEDIWEEIRTNMYLDFIEYAQKGSDKSTEIEVIDGFDQSQYADKRKGNKDWKIIKNPVFTLNYGYYSNSIGKSSSFGIYDVFQNITQNCRHNEGTTFSDLQELTTVNRYKVNSYSNHLVYKCTYQFFE